MKFLFTLILCTFSIGTLLSQTNKQLFIKDKATGQLIDKVRVEFKEKGTGKVILAVSDETGIVSASLVKDKKYVVTTEKIGYDPSMLDFSPKNDDKPVDVKIRKTAPGVMIKLENVVYEYNKANLNRSGKQQLDTLYRFLKENKRFLIELNSHTDSRGPEEYNLSLSRNRSHSCNNYLKAKGLKFKRVVMNNFGETKLLNQCDDGIECSEELHQINRRTEFVLLFPKE